MKQHVYTTSTTVRKHDPTVSFLLNAVVASVLIVL